ncbi:hypothetical protein ABPG75_004608 [Micractinium tetrahymenae]
MLALQAEATAQIAAEARAQAVGEAAQAAPEERLAAQDAAAAEAAASAQRASWLRAAVSCSGLADANDAQLEDMKLHAVWETRWHGQVQQEASFRLSA